MNKGLDVIFALSSGQGKSGVAIIRVSGKNLNFLEIELKPRMATLIDFYDIDKLIAIYFKAPNSFTGEDIIELHCHGGRAVIQAIFDKLRSFGFRMAEKGEFSRRAFQNGRMDLFQVDAMRALIDAETDKQRQRALRAFADSETYLRWRSEMVEIAAFAAARMDYDSEDLPKNINEEILRKTKNLISELEKALNSNARIIESGFNIVIVGETNVGKSSLFNRLLGQSRAIVSEIPGTTRDVISAELDIDGYLVRLLDTAGIRESKDQIEIIGIGKTYQEIQRADLILRVYDREPKDFEEGIVIINKSDLIKKKKPGFQYVSAKTGEGLDELLKLIKQKIHDALDEAENDLVVSDRARTHLLNALLELKKVEFETVDLQSEHISNAASEIGMILGIIGSDEIYDSVFGRLCLGK